MKKLYLKPNTPEWLEARKAYRTASEAPIVCGISPFQTPEKFKMIKLGLAKQYYSKAMADGHKYEDQVRQWANKELGYNFKEEIWVNGDYLASLDGIDGETLIEIKVSERTFDDIKAGRLPEYYLTQMQQQMYCSPATRGFLVAYSKKRDDYVASTLILEDPRYMKHIEDSWGLFDLIEIDEHTPLDRSEDRRIVELFNRYDRLKAELDTVKMAMELTKEELIKEAGDRSLVAGDFKLVRSKPTTRYDYKKAATDAKVDLDKYKSEGKPTFSVKLPPNPFKE